MQAGAGALHKKTYTRSKNREQKSGGRGRTWRRESGGVGKIKIKIITQRLGVIWLSRARTSCETHSHTHAHTRKHFIDFIAAFAKRSLSEEDKEKTCLDKESTDGFIM